VHVIACMTAWQQHDVQELCRAMFDALELTWQNTSQSNVINELYEGKMKDCVQCLQVLKQHLVNLLQCFILIIIIVMKNNKQICIVPLGPDFKGAGARPS